jgi:hypothetical protein
VTEAQLNAATCPLPAAERTVRLQQLHVQQHDVLDALRQLDAAGCDHLHLHERNARVMKCGPALLLAYNAQAVADHDSDLIVAQHVVVEENDHPLLVPMMEHVVHTTGAMATQSVFDTGYFSGAQLAEAQRKRLPVLVPVQEESAKGPYAKSLFQYDPLRDGYVCPQGELLPREGTRKPTADRPYPTTIYRCHNDGCPVRAQCTGGQRGRLVRRTPFDEAIARQQEKNEQPAHQILLSLRKEIIEHVFGCIKGNDGFRRFSVRGLAKVRAQWALVCSVFNLRKLYPAWLSGTLSFV